MTAPMACLQYARWTLISKQVRKYSSNFERYFQLLKSTYLLNHHFLAPPMSLTIDGPDSLRHDSSVEFTCSALETYIPFNLTLNITNLEMDYLGDLETNSLITVSPAIYTQYEDEFGYDRWNISQLITVTPNLTQKMCFLSDQLNIGCHIFDLYYEEKLLSSVIKTVSITGKSIPIHFLKLSSSLIV